MYVIRTQKLATFLINCGFRLEKIDRNKENPRFNVFLFNDTAELRHAVENYKNIK